jgi:uncharacterized damage-inducible protein DinB|tara:strand:- start:1903 stop:2409 length:507 start_codon:yes stop_codon:yes gene_type:complete
MNPLTSEIIKTSCYYFKENNLKVIKCLDTLNESALWHRPNEVSNAIGNQLLHLCGNIHQYVISSLGNQKDIRNRALEFSERSGYSKKELISLINQKVADAIKIIASLDEKALLKVRPVQTYSFSGIQILIHATEHFSYHTGQIAFWTKYLTNKDLEFYANQNLNQKDR